MALLSKQQIFEADDIETEDVHVPKWGGEVRLRGLSGSERDRYEDSLAKMKNGETVPDMVNARARLVAWSAIDEGGRRIFTDADILKLGTKSAKSLALCFDVACALSGITPEDQEQLAEGFTDDQSEPSISD
ncbi:hypothetical protein ACMA1D_10675 [Streptomyces sp. 796.1]|uniref:hypothetical protein n=1 Tax=Streptomyces sp. 796.1 TaxID=3163029 RepID=UPI0039C9B7C1